MTPAPSISYYLHVPFCKHACPYCDFYKMELRDRPARERIDFPARLAREGRLLLDAHPEVAARPIASIYFGGGTPSVLGPRSVEDLIHDIRCMHPDAARAPEVTLEANPENLTAARCAAWREAGFDRLSIGVQSFHQRDLALLERLHAPEAIPRAVRNARDAGFRNLSLDLMFALPGQTLEEWRENLRRALELEPEHLSFYGLTIHERTPFHDLARAKRLALPDDDVQAEMYIEGCRALRDAGFEHYEISNFARTGHRSVHNQRYWMGDDVVGLGPGAHSSLGGLRWHNPDDIDAWKAAVDDGRLARSHPEQLQAEELHEELLFRGLRRIEGLGQELAGARALLDRWLRTEAGAAAVEQGWIVREGDRVRLTEEGWLRSDAILLAALPAARRA